MLSLAVKNSLLVVLIILILHFMMKNYLLENVDTHRKTHQHQTQKNDSFTQSTAIKEKQYITENPHITLTKPIKTHDADELYKFVFENESNQSPMCKQEQIFVPESSTLQAPKQQVAQSLNFENLVLNEYENESPLNGGHIYGNLSGYDSYSGDYVSI